MAHCFIYGVFREDSRKALDKAQSLGAWGGCSYSCEGIDDENRDPFGELVPEKDGYISFDLFGRAPFDKLHKIAKAICEEGQDYKVRVSEWNLPI